MSVFIQYTYIVGKYIIYLYELYKQVEKSAFWWAFTVFRSEWKLILYLLKMNIYCVYLATPKGSKQPLICLKRAEKG